MSTDNFKSLERDTRTSKETARLTIGIPRLLATVMAAEVEQRYNGNRSAFIRELVLDYFRRQGSN